MMLLQTLFEFIFGCRHRHLSRVFTIKRRTYQVCFDCGREFDMPDTLGAGSGVTGVKQELQLAADAAGLGTFAVTDSDTPTTRGLIRSVRQSEYINGSSVTRISARP